MRLGQIIALLGALALQLVMAIVVLPAFSRLHDGLGGEAPLVTSLVCSAGFRYGLAAWIAIGGGLALVARRCRLFKLVIASCALAWVATLFAVYAPLFAMAGQIRE